MHESGINRPQTPAEVRKRCSPARRLGLRLAIAGASVAAGLALVEVAFRVTRGTPWYERVAQEQGHPDWVFQTIAGSEIPLRQPLEDKPKDIDTYSVLFLGDSVTYGQGITDPSRVFVSLVADRLRAARPVPGVARYQVFNGGIPGSLTQHWCQLFSDTSDRLRPDLVVCVFFLRDGVAGVSSVGQINDIRQGMADLAAGDSWLFRYSYTYRYFRERRELAELSRRYLGKLRDGYLGGPDQIQEWSLAQKNLLSLRRQTLRRGGRFALVIFPVLFQLDEDYPLKDVCDEIERFCRNQDIPVLSLLPTFMNKNAPSLWVSPFDPHPNERGHALAAEAIDGFLERLIRE
jgi:hypothetical protein